MFTIAEDIKSGIETTWKKKVSLKRTSRFEEEPHRIFSERKVQSFKLKSQLIIQVVEESSQKEN